MDIELQKAAPADIDGLLSVCRLASVEEGSQWNELYPDRETLEQDMSRDAMYKIIIDGSVAGLIAVGAVGEYEELDWHGGGSRPGEMARLGLLPEYQGQGLARKIIEIGLELLRAQGYDTVRFLANPLNKRVVGLYDRMGFENQGKIREWELDFYMYQRLI